MDPACTNERTSRTSLFKALWCWFEDLLTTLDLSFELNSRRLIEELLRTGDVSSVIASTTSFASVIISCVGD